MFRKSLSGEGSSAPRNAVAIAALGATATLVAGGVTLIARDGGSANGPRNTQELVVDSPAAPTIVEATSTPAASIAPVKTKPSPMARRPAETKPSPVAIRPVETATSKPIIKAPVETKAPIIQPTHHETRPVPAQWNEKAAADKEVKRMQNRVKGQVLNILDMAEDESLEFTGPVYDGPSEFETRSDYLATTRIKNPEVVTLENGTQSICGAVSSPNDIHCVFPVNGKYTIVNNTSGVTREIVATDIQVVQKEVASVDEYGFAHADNDELLATNPPQE